jgi:hypothetical protein
MPTDREREYYRMGYEDGVNSDILGSKGPSRNVKTLKQLSKAKPKRKLSAWNKFVKANSSKKIYKFANGKLKLKKMGIAFRKTPAGRKK